MDLRRLCRNIDCIIVQFLRVVNDFIAIFWNFPSDFPKMPTSFARKADLGLRFSVIRKIFVFRESRFFAFYDKNCESGYVKFSKIR